MTYSLAEQAAIALKKMSEDDIQKIELAIKDNIDETVANMSPVLQEAFKKQIVTRRRIIGLEKARATKAENLANPYTVAARDLRTNGQFWGDVYLTILKNREVKGLTAAKECIQVTDTIIEALKAEGKIL